MLIRFHEYDWKGKRLNGEALSFADAEELEVDQIVARVMATMAKHGEVILDYFTGESVDLSPGRGETWRTAYCRASHYSWIGREAFEAELRAGLAE